MPDSNIDNDSDDAPVSNEEFAEAELLARRALELNKDDEEARKLWKLSRRGQGKSLGSDLPETLRKEIYAEHAQAVERRLFLTQDLTTRLQQAENPHKLVHTSIENASSGARDFIISKYTLTSFELDLILHEGEKECWPVTPSPSTDDSAAPSSWYHARNETKHVRQVVIKLAPDTRSAPRVDRLPTDSAFTAPNWAVTVVLDSASAVPLVFAKATGAIDLVDHRPAEVVFAFYHLERGGVFQVFVQVDSPEVRSKFGYPFLAEHARWLDETDDRRVIEALIATDKVELCFVAPDENRSLKTFFNLTANVPADCKAKLQQEWEELQRHHDSVAFKDFQVALDQYNQENPMEESPVLPQSEPIKQAEPPRSQDQELPDETLGAIFQALSSKDVKEGDILEIRQDGTVGVNTGGLGLTDYDIVELYNHGIRKVGDVELTHGVYEMAQFELEMGAPHELSDLARALIEEKRGKQKTKRKKKPKVETTPKKKVVTRAARNPIEIRRLVLIPVAVTIAVNMFGMFVFHWLPLSYVLANIFLMVGVGIYSAFRLDRAGEWPPENSTSDNPRGDLGGCIGGLFVVGIVLAVLGGAMKLSNTIMMPIVFSSMIIYGLFQLFVYPKLLKTLFLYTCIVRVPEIIGLFLVTPGIEQDRIGVAHVLRLSVATPLYATWFGMITAAILDWHNERTGRTSAFPINDEQARDHYQRGMKNSKQENWKEAVRDFSAAVESDPDSPIYLYSLAVARVQNAPKEASDEEKQKYYLDVCGLFEEAVILDEINPELNKEAYLKVAWTCGALYRSLQRHKDALRLFEIGLKHYPDDRQLLAGAGWSQFDLGQITDAEKTVSRLLEIAPDSDDGRQLWKAIRKARGQDLTADLSEDLKRRIYQEYLQEKDRIFAQGYMDSGVSGKLSFEELASEISGKAEEAELKVRRMLLEKYGIKEFEFDLIVKQGEREAWN